MRDQMVCFLESVGIPDVFQSSYRSGHSTVTVELNITDDIHGYLDRGFFVVLVLLDFSVRIISAGGVCPRDRSYIRGCFSVLCCG
jgi:hypothetical protein